ncbi:TonB-dependent receptor plug domain-containing protein [Cryomorphaceae bacterium S-15]|uniref:TonB-dependent receptor plug domain-containing protein n=2 Tax=Acidiluteibacter ferrifornacis TaxID=2692424 RepID=A0A6N9NKC2_9FLAO|nr:TonB-dependent receptor plug domain-containing protein [Acidiluteibacter ferrifornacis]
MKLIALFLFNAVIGLNTAFTQTPTQTLRGRIVDIDSKSAIPFASVVIDNSDPMIGVTSDIDGNFKIENVPVGRVTLKISSIGYELVTIPNVLLISGKETVLSIDMKESFTQLEEVEIRANKRNESSNEMALLSSKQLSIEESKRHAGAISDPARLVSSFAGVSNEGSGNNDIIVRGNNPRFIQWRLEGIEIPNPNHFAIEGLTGGPINALNSQMLDNSEFYSGAFAPEYGNALSGIFDMKLRKGNDEQQEYSFSVGVLGIDFTAEGPMGKKGTDSYLFNYRYSTLSLLDDAGVVDFGGVPKYQDLSYKVFVSTKKAGHFTFFGLGGVSKISFVTEDEDNEDLILEDGAQKSMLGVSGIKHFIPFGDKTYLKSTVSFGYNSSELIEKRPYRDEALKEFYNAELNNQTYRAVSTLHHKFNAKHKIQVGLSNAFNQFDFENEFFSVSEEQYRIGQANNGSANFSQGFISWQWRVTELLTAVSGVHFSKSSLNRKVAGEPRLALKYQLNETQNLNAGFGLHSKMSSLPNHYAIVYQEDGSYTTPNKDLELMQAAHYVLGYENTLTPNLFFKAEAYYQHLYNIPVGVAPASQYSLINQDDIFVDKALVNEGEGRNIGIELTLERYFSKQYYFLITTSIYDSKYKARTGGWKESRYNGNYVGNILFGKEFTVGQKESTDKTISVNSRVTLLGGRRYTPINLEESIQQDKEVLYEELSFSKKADDVLYLNLAASYRINKPKLSHEIKLDIQNITNNQTAIDYYYNSIRDEIGEISQLAILPVLSYTINF